MCLGIRDQSALRRNFVIKMEQIKREWAKLHNVEPHSLSCSTDTMIPMKWGWSEGNRKNSFVDKPQE
jgi:hypothetical protein